MITRRFDIYVGGRFKCTMCLRTPPQWIFSEEELVAEVYSRYPSLKGKNWSFT